MKKLLVAIVSMAMVVVSAFSLIGCSSIGNKVGVQAGTTGEYYVKGDEGWGFDGYSNIECKAYNNGGLAVSDMKNGNVDFVVIDEAPAKYLVEKIAGIKVIDVKLTDEQYAFGVNKTDSALLTSVNAFLSQIKSNGTFDTIMNKYFGDGTPTGVASATKDLGNAAGQLVVATNAAFAPFEYKEGNLFYGVDMEIAKALADYLNLELVIDDMDFDSVVTSVGTNGVDMAMAGLTVNETRKASVNFSNSYYNAAQMIVCLNSDNTFADCTTAAEVEAILKGLTASK